MAVQKITIRYPSENDALVIFRSTYKITRMSENAFLDEAVRPTRVSVTFLDTTRAPARAEGDVAAWICKCGDHLPLLGRCDSRIAICPACYRKYRVVPTRVSKDVRRKVRGIVELE